MTLTLTDLFCGAGGSSQGAVQVPGVDLRLAANHWQLAVETHAANFPDADHDTANISQVDFRRYPATDLLWASPECTNHSQARGVSKRSLTVQTTSATKALAMLVPAGGTWNESATSVGDPMRARTTRDTEALVVPVEGRDGVSARPAAGPMRAQTARLQDALVVPLRANGHARPVATEPLPTFAAGGTHHALVMRNNSSRVGDGAEMCTPISEALRTLTTAGHQSLIRWDDRVYAYDTGYLAPVADPLATQTTVQGDALLGPAVAVEDCLFRMLEPHEIGAGMAFAPEYRVLGNKRERVRQYGNAVTPPAARDLIAALVEAITGDDVERAS